jgi:hypothetical protein
MLQTPFSVSLSLIMISVARPGPRGIQAQAGCGIGTCPDSPTNAMNPAAQQWLTVTPAVVVLVMNSGLVPALSGFKFGGGLRGGGMPLHDPSHTSDYPILSLLPGQTHRVRRNSESDSV